MDAGEIAILGKSIGAGIAALALFGAALGVGNIVGSFLSGALRNPSAAPSQFVNLILGIAFAEAAGLFGFVVSMVIIFVLN